VSSDAHSLRRVSPSLFLSLSLSARVTRARLDFSSPLVAAGAREIERSKSVSSNHLKSLSLSLSLFLGED